MKFLKRIFNVHSVHISTPFVSVGLSINSDDEGKNEQSCRYDAIRSDILALNGISALVVPTNQHFRPGNKSLDRFAYEAAGERLLKDLRSLGTCKPGTAEVTKAYDLPYKYIIHVVSKEWDGNTVENEEALKRCYVCALEKALEYKIRSIAFPSIGTGSNKFPVTKAAGIAINTVEEFVEKHSECFDKIVWVFNNDETYETYKDILSS